MALLIDFSSGVRSGATAGCGATAATVGPAASVPVMGFFFGCCSSAAFPSCPPVHPASRSAERSAAAASVAVAPVRPLMKRLNSNGCAVEGRGQRAEGRSEGRGQKAEGRGASRTLLPSAFCLLPTISEAPTPDSTEDPGWAPSPWTGTSSLPPFARRRAGAVRRCGCDRGPSRRRSGPRAFRRSRRRSWPRR